MSKPLQDLAERLWSKVDWSDGPGNCWPFIGLLNHHGYGRLGGSNGGLAHRIAYQLTIGPIPLGMFVCHTCDNPRCCNPSHLVVGTAADNSRDMTAKGRSHHVTGERTGKTRLTSTQIFEIRRRYHAGESQVSLSREFGVHSSHISRILRGLRRTRATCVPGLGWPLRDEEMV